MGASPDQNPCDIESCIFPAVSNGWCSTHYQRWRKNGDPLVTQRRAATKPVDLPDGRRVCKQCGIPSAIENFDADRQASTGRRSDCKQCRSAYMKKLYSETAEQRREYMRNRRISDGERVREIDALRYLRDKDKRIEAATEFSHLRRARIASAGSDKGITRNALRERDGDGCHYCGRVMDFQRYERGMGHGGIATIEHVIPISKGGENRWSNCVLACRDCNFRKGAKLADEWGGLNGCEPDLVSQGGEPATAH